MNLLLVLAGLRAWRGDPTQIVTRILAAVSIVSLEIQFVTWTGLGSLHTLVAYTVPIAAGLFWWTSRGSEPGPSEWTRHARYLLPAALALGVVVAILNLALPFTPVDPYHVERLSAIERLGTIAYDPTVDRNDPRLNVLNWLYEFLLADLRQVPAVGPWLAQMHGLLGLAVYSLAAWSTLILLNAPARWLGAMLFVVPVVFHQFVLVKNDLFDAVPAMLALAWTLQRQTTATHRECLWAGWLAGLTVAIKLTSFPVAVVLLIGTLARRDPKAAAALVAGGALGALSGGLVFTLVENVRLYGDALAPLMAVNGRPVDVADAATSVVRFAVSLVDMGVLSRQLWPRIGGWGGTYGLPLVWALVVLLATARRAPEARRALWMVLVIWVLSSASNIDMSANHRYVLAPGVLLVAVAASLAGDDRLVPAWLRRAAVVVMALSALQILRSATLYLIRG